MIDLPAQLQEKMKLVFVNKSLFSRRWRALTVLTLGVVIVYFLITYYISQRAVSASPSATVVGVPSTERLSDGSLLLASTDWQWLDKDKDVGDASMRAVPSYMLRENNCPACYGDEVCEEISSGEIQIKMSAAPYKTASKTAAKGVYFGKWQGKDIVVKTLDNDDAHNFQLFDSFICTNQSLPVGCDVSSAILNPKCVAVQERSFLPENMQSAWKIVHEGPEGLS